MESQESIREAIASRDWLTAFRLAAKLCKYGPHKEAISRGWQAMRSPDFYRSIGQDPQALIEQGQEALALNYREETR